MIVEEVSPPIEQLLTVRQLAAYLNVEQHGIYRMTERQGLPCVRYGSHLRFRKEDVDLWLSRSHVRYRQKG